MQADTPKVHLLTTAREAALQCALRWRAWFLLRVVDARMALQDWQGFRLHKVYLINIVGRTKENITFLREDVDTATLPNGTVLEYRYTFRDQRYRVQFCKGDKVAFPPYSVQDVPRVVRKGVLMAVTNSNVNVAGVLKQYAGPLGDFHASCGGRLAMRNMWFKNGLVYDNIKIMNRQFKISTLHAEDCVRTEPVPARLDDYAPDSRACEEKVAVRKVDLDNAPALARGEQG